MAAPSNFDFLLPRWPAFHTEAKRVERDTLFDPLTTCIFARRTLEVAVSWMYQVDKSLRQPYKDDLNAHLFEPSFKALVGPTVHVKMDLIRRLGNRAAHQGGKPLTDADALGAARDLFHILYWVATTYAPTPADRPNPEVGFNQALLPKPGASPAVKQTIAQLQKALAELDAKDAAVAAAEQRTADLDAELKALQQQFASAKAANTAKPDTHDYDEAQTRDRFIDLLLRESGWTLTGPHDVEFPVTGMPDGKKGFVDYVLWGEDARPLAVVEAKRTRRDAQSGQQQARLYADCLEQTYGRRPLIYYTNGYEHYFWDDAAYPPRQVQGFHTRDELQLIVGRRGTTDSLMTTPINSAIAGRYYQQRAIRRIAETFQTDRQRRALLVMATGSGKTRTVIALVDLLQRCGWVRRVLFLADRQALVKQAANAFKQLLPDTPTVNLLDDRSADGRVYVSTYPTILNLINRVDGDERRFGPGHFDVVVIDEAHRSVYQKYRSIFSYFDSLLVGLTATPKDEVDRNTYSLFGLEEGVPTDAYPLETAIEEGFLVPPRAVSVPLKIQREGLRYDDLTDEEKERWDEVEWDEDGNVPDAVGAEAVNSWLFNIDTVDQAIGLLMTHGHRVAAGDRIGKTIVFAKNNDHARFIAERFDVAYPQFHGSFARVITHRTDYAQSLIDDFSRPERAPHIAVSVDMLDTGIDIPEVVNLVFFKVIRSKTKFWQMIGRGTRLRPDLYGPGADKTDFFVFDFCQNFEYFGQQPAQTDGSSTPSLSERLFTRRVDLLAELDRQPDVVDGVIVDPDHIDSKSQLRTATADALADRVAGMNLDNILVRPKRREVEQLRNRTTWRSRLGGTGAPEAALADILAVAGLPSELIDSDEDAKRFDLIMLTLEVAVLTGHPTLERERRRVQAIATGLLEQATIPAVQAQAELLGEIAGDDWWVDVTAPMLERARRRLRALVRLLERTTRNRVVVDFADTVGDMREIVIDGLPSGTDFERFKAKARAFLAAHLDHVAVQRLRRNQPLTNTDLAELERMLAESGAGDIDDLHRAAVESQGLGRFIRSLVGMDRAAATEALADFLDGRVLNGNQLEFINLIIEYLTQHGDMDAALLYEPPFTDLAPTGPEQLFPHEDVDRLVEALARIRVGAGVA